MLPGQLVDGTKLDGPASLRQALLDRSDVFVRTADGKAADLRPGRRTEVLRYAGGSLDRPGTPAGTTTVFHRWFSDCEKRSVSDEGETSESRSGGTTMTFITKKHLPRRTFLRGMGVTLALPLLDSMVPAQTPLAKTRRQSQQPPELHLRSARRHDGQVDARDGRHGLRVHRNPQRRSRSFAIDLRGVQPGASGGRRSGSRCRRRPRAFGRGVPERRSSREGRRSASAPPSIRSPRSSIGQDTPLPSLELSIEDVALSCGSGYACAYYQHDFLEDAHHAAAHGEQSAGGLREAFRRRQQQRGPAGAQAAEPQPARFGDGRGGFACRRDLPAAGPHPAQRVPRRRARNRAAHPEGRSNRLRPI